MKGDEGPYMNDDGDIWVPARTVPYLEARKIARTGVQEYGDRLVYVGKSEATLFGFTRDCLCDESCEDARDENDEPTGWEPCRVPAWHFRSEGAPRCLTRPR